MEQGKYQFEEREEAKMVKRTWSKRFSLLTISLALLLQVAFIGSVSKAHAQEAPPIGVNLVTNPSFEQVTGGIPDGWEAYDHWSGANVGVVADAHIGTKGVQIHADNSSNPWISQVIPVEERATYDLTSWYRSTDLRGNGAEIKVEYYSGVPTSSANYVDQYFAGKYQKDVSGNWTSFTREMIVPNGAKYARLYIRLFGAGSLTYDDIEFKKVKDPVALVNSDTDQIIYYSDKSQGAVRVKIDLAPEYYPERTFDVTVSHQPDGAVLASASGLPAISSYDYLFDPRLMTRQEPYQVDIVLRDLAGNEVEHKTIGPIYRFDRPTSLQADGTLIVDGQPFTPHIMYHVGETDYDKMPALGINTVQGKAGGDAARIKQLLDYAQAAGVKMLVPLYRNNVITGNFEYYKEIVTANKDHPALIGWMMIDEPADKYTIDEMTEAYRIVRSIDPVHPMYLVEDHPQFMERDGKLTDVLAIDPYPFPNNPITMVASHVASARAAVHDEKPVWTILQAFNFPGNPTWPYLPTIDEERNMAYQAIVSGAKGYGYYSYNDSPAFYLPNSALFPGMQAFASEYPLMDTLSRTPKATESGFGNTQWATWELNGDVYAVVLNYTNAQQDVSVQLPISGYSGSLLYGGDADSVSSYGSTLGVTIGSHQAYVYKLTSIAEGMNRLKSSLTNAESLSTDAAWKARLESIIRIVESIGVDASASPIDVQTLVADTDRAVREVDLLTRWTEHLKPEQLGGDRTAMLAALADASSKLRDVAEAQAKVEIALPDNRFLRGSQPVIGYTVTNTGVKPLTNASFTASLPASLASEPLTQTIAALEPGQSITFEQTVNVPNDLSDTSVTVQAAVSFVDKGVQFTPNASQTYSVVNPIEASVTPQTISTKVSGSTTVKLTLTNQLATGTSANVQADSVAGITATFPSAVTLAAGETKTVSGTVTVTNAAVDGTYSIPIHVVWDGQTIVSPNVTVTLNRNLVTNPSFEPDATGVLNGWAQKSAVWDAAVAHSGTHSIQLSYIPGADNQFRSATASYMTVTPGKTYELSGWIRNLATQGSFTFQARLISSAGSTYLTKTLPLNAGDWTQISIPFTAPAGVTTVAVYFNAGPTTNGPAWLDDVYFSEVLQP
jgi:hypothetical protein